MCDPAAMLPLPGTSPQDRLLIAALRCHAAGAGCDLLGFFDLVLGAHAAPPAARALAGFARALLAAARRPPRLGHPGDPPTPHECAAIGLVAAIRASDPERAAGLLAWLGAPASRPRLLAAAVGLELALQGHGLGAAAE
jgi:hypothetical protein